MSQISDSSHYTPGYKEEKNTPKQRVSPLTGIGSLPGISQIIGIGWMITGAVHLITSSSIYIGHKVKNTLTEQHRVERLPQTTPTDAETQSELCVTMNSADEDKAKAALETVKKDAHRFVAAMMTTFLPFGGLIAASAYLSKFAPIIGPDGKQTMTETASQVLFESFLGFTKKIPAVRKKVFETADDTVRDVSLDMLLCSRAGFSQQLISVNRGDGALHLLRCFCSFDKKKKYKNSCVISGIWYLWRSSLS